jgi:hypothetical protein
MSFLTTDDIDLILEGLGALDELERNKLSLSALTRATLGRQEVDVELEFEELKERRRPKAEATTILTAKLLMLRDKKEIAELNLEDL